MASAIGAAALVALGSIGACREAPPAEVPPLTTARPSAPLEIGPGKPAIVEAGAREAAPPGASAAAQEAPVKASFVDLPTKIDDGLCARVLVALVTGKATARSETLGPGDVLVVAHAEPIDIQGSGLAVVARRSFAPCVVRDRPAPEQIVVRATAAPELTWAGGAMHAHLDVGPKVSPHVYLGRLEGTAPVAEHVHPGTWEILAAIDAAGAFTLGGVERRLGPRQIVVVPPDTKHAWRPDPGSKLVAIQMYDPPGPEQRFVALAAAGKDAGVDGGGK